jgi:hypothetical protein
MILIQLIGCAKTPTTEIKTDTITDTHITEEPAGETIFTLRNGVFLVLGACLLCCIYKCWSVHPIQTVLLEKWNTEKRLRAPHITTNTTQRLQQAIQENPPTSPLYFPPSRLSASRRARGEGATQTRELSRQDVQKATAQLRARIGNGIILLLTQKGFKKYLPKIWAALRHEAPMPTQWTSDMDDQAEGLIASVLGLPYLTKEVFDIFETANRTSLGQLAYLHSIVLAEHSDFLAERAEREERLDTASTQEEMRTRILEAQEGKPESYITTLREQTAFHSVRLNEALNKGQAGAFAAQEHAKQLVFDLASYVFYYERRPFIIQDDPLPF